MTIDKFGRSSKSSNEKDIKGPKGDGFNLTTDGHYDINGKRLTNLGDVLEPFDATTKTYVDSKVIPLDKEGFNLGRKRIINLDDALDNSDAVNFQTLKRICLTVKGSNFNANQMQINNLSKPVQPGDAATKQFVDKVCKKVHTLVNSDLAKQEEVSNSLKERIAKCEELIVRNKDHHDNELKKFGVLLFKYVHRKPLGRSFVFPTDGQVNSLNWEVLFADESLGDKTEEEEVKPLPPNTYDLFMTEEGLTSREENKKAA